MSPPPWTLFCPLSGTSPDVVRRVVVLGDAERPADLRPVRPGVVVRELPDQLLRHAGVALGPLKRVLGDGLLVRLEVDGGAPDELLVDQAGLDDLVGDRVGQADVRADVDAEPGVRPLGGA
jgi:hypothetical protein